MDHDDRAAGNYHYNGAIVDARVYINGVLDDDLKVLRLVRSYVRPWTCEIAYSGRHDYEGGQQIDLYDWVYVRDADTGTILFRGNVMEVRPGGVGQEGIFWLCEGRRFRLQNEVVQINGSCSYVWNRRGFRCSAGGGEDSPGQDGGKWTAGELIVDILEHALGFPNAVSDIPGHHGDACCVTDTYLTGLDIAGYNGIDWLAIDTVIGEFSVSSTPVAEAIDLLLGMAGGFWGWYIDQYGVLQVHSLPTLPATNLAAGELEHWQDEAGKDYVLLDNRVDWSLDGVYSEVVVQGTDRTVEVKPVNIEGSGNPALNGGGELERVAGPWRGYATAHRALCQPYRRWTEKGVGWTGSCEPPGGAECGVPDNVDGIGHGPRIYRGTDAGAKTYLRRLGGGRRWIISLATGMVMFFWDPLLGVNEKLWGWYWARLPFTASSGPGGSAYDCFGYSRVLWIYDPAFRSVTSHPHAGDAVEVSEMQTLADRMLSQRGDVRLQGTLRCDEVDPYDTHLGRRYNVTNLAAPDIGVCTPSPMDWSEIGLNAVEVQYNFVENVTEITVANSFFMLEVYSALKERMWLNQMITVARDLSSDTLECQVIEDKHDEDAEYTTNELTTTTAAPTTTVVLGTTTAAPAVSTTTAAAYCDCEEIDDTCYKMDFYYSCCDLNYGFDFWWEPLPDEGVLIEHHCQVLESMPMEWHHSEMVPDGKVCVWQGPLVCPWPYPLTGWQTTTAAPVSTTTEIQWDLPADWLVELIFHPVIGWCVIHGENTWLKDVNPMDCLEAEGQYSCACDPPPVGPGGTVMVEEVPCPGLPTLAPTTTVTGTSTTVTATSTTATGTSTTTTAAGPMEDCCYHCVLHSAGTATLTLNCQGCGPEGCPDVEGCLYDLAPGYSGNAGDPLCYRPAPPCVPWPRDDDLGVKKAYHLVDNSCYG